MAIKGKKRAVENVAASVKTEVQQQPLKKKVKVEKVTKPVAKPNGISAVKPAKVDKTNKKVSEVKGEAGVAPVKTEKINTKVELKGETGVAPVKKEKTNKKVSGIKLDNGVASVKSVKVEKAPENNEANVNEGAKLAAQIKQKAKKREIKKQKLANFEPDRILATVEELEAQIEKIRSREVITNTARRRLGVLKKKLRIKQGTYKPPTSKPELQGMSKAEKRKYRRQRAAIMRKENNAETKNEAVTEVKSIAKDAANAVKGIKTKTQDKKQLQNTKIIEKKGNNVDKKGKPELNKEKTKNEKVAVLPVSKKNEDDDDEDDDDEEDENESMNVSNNSTNTLDNDDDDDDDDDVDDDDDDDDDDEEDEDAGDDDEDEDEDDEEEEEKAEIKKPINKSKNDKQNTKSDTNGIKNEKITKKNQPETSNASPKKSRYVLFVGNLPYTATVDDIKNHFLTKVKEVVSVRIPQSPQNTPRGFAYIEFSNNIDYEKGLSLHESNLNGRRINVQYSQSGSKNVGKRPNVVAKNQKLHALRKQGKLAGSTKDSQKRNARRNKGKNQAS